MSIYNMEIENKKGDFKQQINYSTCSILLNSLLNFGYCEITHNLYNNSILFNINNENTHTFITHSDYEEDYLDWKSIIHEHKENANELFSINIKKLLNALLFVKSSIQNKDDMDIYITVNENLTIEKDIDYSILETVNVKAVYEKCHFRFNILFLIEILKPLKSGFVVFSSDMNNTHPIFIKEEYNNNFLSVIMPMRNEG